VDDSGTVVGPFLPQWTGLPLAEVVGNSLADAAHRQRHEFEADRPPRIKVAKDADLGCLAAWSNSALELREIGSDDGAGPALWTGDSPASKQSLLYFKASHGFDAGLVYRDRLVVGSHALGLQIGHMNAQLHLGATSQEDATGKGTPAEPCPRCGRLYCLESLASGEALVRGLRSSAGPEAPNDLDELVRQVSEQQTERPRSYETIVAAGTMVGTVLAEASLTFDPAVIVIGGLLSLAGSAFLRPLKDAFTDVSLSGVQPRLCFVQPERVRKIELAGAVALAQAGLVFEVPRLSQQGGSKRPTAATPAEIGDVPGPALQRDLAEPQ
jgi:hypothetical protein